MQGDGRLLEHHVEVVGELARRRGSPEVVAKVWFEKLRTADPNYDHVDGRRNGKFVKLLVEKIGAVRGGVRMEGKPDDVGNIDRICQACAQIDSTTCARRSRDERQLRRISFVGGSYRRRGTLPINFRNPDEFEV